MMNSWRVTQPGWSQGQVPALLVQGGGPVRQLRSRQGEHSVAAEDQPFWRERTSSAATKSYLNVMQFQP